MNFKDSHKYDEVRKKLDDLGYFQTLDPESLPLVNAIITEFLEVKNTLKLSKESLVSVETERRSLEKAIEPIQEQNITLLREINSLKKELIEQKNEQDKKLNNEFKKNFRLEKENEELKFLNSQQIILHKRLEAESSELSKKLFNLQDKSFKTIVSIPGDKKKGKHFKNPTATLPSFLEKANNAIRVERHDPFLCDLLKVADSQNLKQVCLNENLQSEINDLRADNLRLQNIISQNEREQKSIQSLLNLCNIKCDNDEINQRVFAMKTHVDYYLDENLKKEKELNKLKKELEELKAKNKSLNDKIDSINVNESLSPDNSRIFENSNLNDEYNQGEIPESSNFNPQFNITSSDGFTNDFCRTKLRESFNKKCYSCCSVKNSTKCLHACNDKQTTTVSPKSCRKFKSHSNCSSHLCKATCPRSTEKIPGKSSMLKKIQEMENTIQKMHKKTDALEIAKSNLTQCLSLSCGEREKLNAVLEKALEEKEELTEKVRKLSSSISDLKIEISFLQEQKMDLLSSNKEDRAQRLIEKVEDQRDEYRRQTQNLLNLLKKSKESINASADYVLRHDAGAQTEKFAAEMPKELRSDDDCINFYECQIKVMRKNLKDSQTECENIRKQLVQSRSEVKKLNSKILRSSYDNCHVDRDCVDVYNYDNEQILHLRHERDQALEDVKRLFEELDAVRSKLKMTTEGQGIEINRLLKDIYKLKSELNSRYNENIENISKQKVSNFNLRSLEEDNDFMQKEIKKKSIEMQDLAFQLENLRTLLKKTQHNLVDFQNRNETIQCEKNELELKVRHLQERCLQFEHENMRAEQDTAASRQALLKLDCEKDSLQAILDNKSEDLNEMRTAIREKNEQNSELIRKFSQLEQRCDELVMELRTKQAEIERLNGDLAISNEQLKAEGLNKQELIKVKNKMQEDVELLSKDNVALKHDLQIANSTIDDLRDCVQQYVSEVNRVEKILQLKEEEREELLEQYKNLTVEINNMESRHVTLVTEVDSAKLEVASKDAALHASDIKVNSLELDNRVLIEQNNNYQAQVIELSQKLDMANAELSGSRAGEVGLSEDLTSARDLLLQVNVQKDKLMSQLDASNKDKLQITEKLNFLEENLRILEKKLQEEKETVKNLETIIASGRQREYKMQTSQDSKENESITLRNQLAQLSKQLESSALELERSRQQLLEQSEQIMKLRKDLTNESFEKEKSLQELKKLRVLNTSDHNEGISPHSKLTSYRLEDGGSNQRYRSSQYADVENQSSSWAMADRTPEGSRPTGRTSGAATSGSYSLPTSIGSPVGGDVGSVRATSGGLSPNESPLPASGTAAAAQTRWLQNVSSPSPPTETYTLETRDVEKKFL